MKTMVKTESIKLFRMCSKPTLYTLTKCEIFWIYGKNLIGYIPPVEYTDKEILIVIGNTPTEASDLCPKLQSKVISDGGSIMIPRC